MDEDDQESMADTAVMERTGEEAEWVADYLAEHPDFFAARPELLRMMTAPERFGGDTIVDLHRFQMQSLREEIAGLRDCASEVIETSRANLAIQNRTHSAVLALVAAPDLPCLMRVVGDDLPLLLDVDVACVGVEYRDGVQLLIEDARPLPTGTIERLLGDDRDLVLFRSLQDDGTLFGAGSGLVQSAAIARLNCGESAPAAILGFGTRTPGAFHPGQGTELLRFLAKMVEICLARVMPVPASIE